MLPVYLYSLACLRSVSYSQCCLFTYIVLLVFVLSLTANVACLLILSCLSSFCLILPMLPVYLFCPFWIAHSNLFYNVYLLYIPHRISRSGRCTVRWSFTVKTCCSSVPITFNSSISMLEPTPIANTSIFVA